mmetsp:Transcript_10041/g.18940  ORF Transcript_10041/g.18940 Transcript_10041/m.18940 type:complete len:293 (+) Transcript_10041:154-1032(+)
MAPARAIKVLFALVLAQSWAFCSCLGEERFKEVVIYTPENDDNWQRNCSREKSRMVRKVLDEFIFPHLEKAKFNLSASCPLARERDMYYEHESHKQKFRASYWKSLYSNKIFKSEYFIDQHMENRHMDKIPSTADLCLADYCQVFLCDEFAYRYYEGEGPRSRLKHKFARKPCEELGMVSAQSECKELLASCFGGKQFLYDFFKGSVCDMLTCRSFHKLLKNLNRRRPDRFRAIYFTSAVVAFLVLVSYYLVVFLSWMERKQQPDLRRRKNRAFKGKQKGLIDKILNKIKDS